MLYTQACIIIHKRIQIHGKIICQHHRTRIASIKFGGIVLPRESSTTFFQHEIPIEAEIQPLYCFGAPPDIKIQPPPFINHIIIGNISRIYYIWIRFWCAYITPICHRNSANYKVGVAITQLPGM